MCDIEIVEQVFSNGTIHHRQQCSKCGKFLGYKQKPVLDDYIFYFGKYKGNRLDEVPESYLKWLLEQNWVKQNLKEAITIKFFSPKN
tara:strand:+ start:42 stop:302 length:261 start_codon:yes stop_codon:yes gene_type:complete